MPITSPDTGSSRASTKMVAGAPVGRVRTSASTWSVVFWRAWT
jgi:hypothetical protein